MGKNKSSKSTTDTTNTSLPVSSVLKPQESTHASTLTTSSSLVGERAVHTGVLLNCNEIASEIGGALGAARQREAHAHALAADATQDANVTETALYALRAKHRKIFLMKAFGINPDGTKILDPSLVPENIPSYRSVKSVGQYTEMVHILSRWGDDEQLALLPRDDPELIQTHKFRKKHSKKGYNYASSFRVEVIEKHDGSENTLLIDKKSNKIVSHMLNVYDAIWESHAKIGHMGHDKTHDACMEAYYSPTQKLVRIFCQDCFVCLEKQPRVQAHKGAKQPIISSNFRDRFQVDLIDMRTIRKEDVYGNTMRWIMTVKDHSTGLIWLAALPYKKASFVAYELEKYFGFVGYPQIFHTGTFNFTIHISHHVSSLNISYYVVYLTTNASFSITLITQTTVQNSLPPLFASYCFAITPTVILSLDAHELHGTRGQWRAETSSSARFGKAYRVSDDVQVSKITGLNFWDR